MKNLKELAMKGILFWGVLTMGYAVYFVGETIISYKLSEMVRVEQGFEEEVELEDTHNLMSINEYTDLERELFGGVISNEK